MGEKTAGFLNINKPIGMTSHDVVAQVRRLARDTVGKIKIGHAGTLDPLATGVLVLCLDYATRLSEYVMQSRKQYRASVCLGVETDTYDAEGTIRTQVDASHISQQQVETVLEHFKGEIEQVPPLYSAIKRDGKKLYELARAGKSVDVEARPVHIMSIEIVHWDIPEVVLDISCGPGTYIRSLAHDIGENLGVGAHLSALERTRSGRFCVDDAISLDMLMRSDDWRKHIVAPAEALSDWPSIVVTDEQAHDISRGRMIARHADMPHEYIMAYTSDNELLAVLQHRDMLWKPHKVFAGN